MRLWSAKKTKYLPHCKSLLYTKAGSLFLYPSIFQDLGARERQEDSFVFSDLSNIRDTEENGVLAVIADGMGGLSHGEMASQTAVDVILREYQLKEPKEAPLDFLKRSLLRANAAVFDLAYVDGQEVDLGTTMITALILNDFLHWVSVGDSRIYIHRDKKLTQLTRDHVYANHLTQQVKEGRLTRKEAEEHPEKDFLTGYLGLPELKEYSSCSEPMELNSGDILLLCSDGLYNTLSHGEMENLLSVGPEQAAERLGKEALEKKFSYQDNITIVTFLCRKNCKTKK